jgi:predicted transcriptional regulator of viral defense system
LVAAPHVDRVVAEAARHGVVSRQLLLAASITPSMIKRRTASGHLIPLHRGVYAVGHSRLRREGWWLAAVWACGPGAVLSHRDAAALHDLRSSGATRIEVSTPAKSRPTGIQVHGRRSLAAEDVTTVDGIPVTTVARTLVDLAGVVHHELLAKALSEAERQHKLDVRAIERVLERTRGRRGRDHAAIRAALAELRDHGTTLTRSSLEDAFLRLIDDAGLPRPKTNATMGTYEVDASGRSTASPWSSTAGPSTTTGAPSSATARRRTRSRSPAARSCASPTHR